MRDIDKSLALGGDTPGHFGAKGDVLVQCGKERKAEAVYLEGMEKFPKNHDLKVDLAELYSSLGREEDAIRFLKGYLKRDKDDGWALYNLALNYKWLGRLDKAIDVFKRLMEVDDCEVFDCDVLVLNELSQCYALQGDFEAGLDACNTALVLDSTDADFMAAGESSCVSWQKQ